MANQRLMCVWQAVSAMQNNSERTALKENVKTVTKSLAHLQCALWSEEEFNDSFPRNTVEFNDFCSYVKNKLKDPTSPVFVLEEEIENICWVKCQENLALDRYPWATDRTIKKLWRIFNRLSEPSTMPPVMAAEDVIWLMEKLAVHVGQSWVTCNLRKDLVFADVLKFLHSQLMERASKATAEKAVQEIHSWLVQEVYLSGWLWKRSKKNANWTTWLRRWVVLTPGTLSYFDGPKLKTKKGQIDINTETIIADSPDLKRFGRRLTACFSIINRPSLHMDFAAMDENDKSTWMGALLELQEAAFSGTSPLQAVLTERRKNTEKKTSLDEAARRISSRKLSVKATSRSPGTKTKFRHPPKKGEINVKEPTKMADMTDEQKEKIRALFFQIDKDGNGKIDCAEFYAFLKSLGLEMPEKEVQLIFDGIEEKQVSINSVIYKIC